MLMACVLTRVCVDVDVCARLDIVCVDVRAGVTHGFKVSMGYAVVIRC